MIISVEEEIAHHEQQQKLPPAVIREDTPHAIQH
ncbi:hypothetical protein CH54_4079 [Yersinia rochesterensis]|uniref:Uncharacterized protein n=1 Tax=Yersinia rochesterensis TaxID=1604335 RepID=A0ABM5SLD4_9GAMM|nr:hypothetical protein DJ57_820 [Yersinia rochesterensis]AJI85591.1 hypothetical protein AW19_1707 [Yersinia frederiksenii Y225]AJJ35303.1 hypothetical protein CH54_4079 [Yersinia rochesterensis]CRY60921.1 Uncharacterised protein [Yersinia kristensenii]